MKTELATKTLQKTQKGGRSVLIIWPGVDVLKNFWEEF